MRAMYLLPHSLRIGVLALPLRRQWEPPLHLRASDGSVSPHLPQQRLCPPPPLPRQRLCPLLLFFLYGDGDLSSSSATAPPPLARQRRRCPIVFLSARGGALPYPSPSPSIGEMRSLPCIHQQAALHPSSVTGCVGCMPTVVLHGRRGA
jgi:hypothetical protein